MKLKLIKKQDEAKGTKSFFWETESPVSWLPGQYFYYTLPTLKYPDTRGATRHFTISSSPTEGATLRLTTRIREESGFKKTLDELQIGQVLEGQGPEGTFILDENEKEKNHVFLAGGIGITPFRAFIKYNIDKNLQIPMHLIYSNSVPEEIAFRKELEDWAKNYPYIKVAMTISKPEESKETWSGQIGRIDELKISEFTGNWELEIGNLTWWVVGPPVFIDAMEEVLSKMKISSDKIRSEKFTGY
ncbi:FAD-dependent oxidoreductase [Candidatus Curtissbacteria bacterium]|nr:FAD-dependent oxidoreductase [Candidatus Curtissbacteria bacterium]